MRGSAAVNICEFSNYGCPGAKKHKTNRSKHCIFFGMKKDEVIGECIYFSTRYYAKIVYIFLTVIDYCFIQHVQMQYKFMKMESQKVIIPKTIQINLSRKILY